MSIFTIFLRFYGFFVRNQYCRTFDFTSRTIVEIINFAYISINRRNKRQELAKNEFFTILTVEEGESVTL